MKEVGVKICGLTSVEAVEAAFALGATYGAVNFYPASPRFVEPEKARELVARMPVGSRVAVGVEPSAQELEAWGDLGFDYFQIHAGIDVSIATLATWSGLVSAERLWLAPRIPPGEDFPQFALNFVETVVVDTFRTGQVGGTGETGDWSSFQRWSTQYPHKQWILAGGLSPENSVEAIAATGASTIDLNSGVESVPGRKDPERMRMLFDNLRAAGFEATAPRRPAD